MKFDYQPKTSLEKFGLIVYNSLVDNFPQTFFVGGMVRDLLLHREVTDVDIATSAKPEQVAQILKNRFLDFNLGYKNLGVVIASQDKFNIAVTSFRKDTYQENRYPEIKFVKIPQLDSQRRDFTINSLYLSPKKNQILDFHNGVGDIKKKLIRFIGNPDKRIREDPLRIVRALRFKILLNFKLEKTTGTAIIKNYNLLSQLTQSKIQSEIGKLQKKTQQKILKLALTSEKYLDKK